MLKQLLVKATIAVWFMLLKTPWLVLLSSDISGCWSVKLCCLVWKFVTRLPLGGSCGYFIVVRLSFLKPDLSKIRWFHFKTCSLCSSLCWLDWKRCGAASDLAVVTGRLCGAWSVGFGFRKVAQTWVLTRIWVP